MINEFEYKGKKYIRIDFKNQFTFEQDDIFEPIGKRVTEVALYLSQEAKKLPVIDSEDEERKAELQQERSNAELQLGLKLKELFQSSKILPELLAHVWLDETDSEFDPVTYKERVTMFKKMPLSKREGLEEPIADFLSAAMKSSTADTLSFIQKAPK